MLQPSGGFSSYLTYSMGGVAVATHLFRPWALKNILALLCDSGRTRRESN